MANCYSERQNNGFFTLLENQLLNLEPTSTFALGAMTYGTDFCSVYSPPEKENGFGRTLFHYLNDNGEKGDEVGLIFFGEMCHSSHGTQISAKGNHSLGRNPKPILDDTVVKDVLVLRPLTGIDPENTFLEDAFSNQVSTLQEIMVEAAKMAPKSSFVTSWLLPTDPQSQSNDNGLIKITMPPKYKVSGTKGEARKKKNLLVPSVPKQEISDTESVSEAGSDGTDGPSSRVKVGALYDPNLLPDHRGKYFQHPNAKLVQQDMVDEEENLIVPWDMPKKLREGTVVLVEATLVCWHISDRKVYQIQGHRLRVLAASDEDIETFEIPNFPNSNIPTEQTPSSSPRKKASCAFSSFAPPTKKARYE
ncbi:hypothetical protein BJ912DRAFT_1052061 [Pholiota molesta]|nr:hypothetical protein BJ912DRAFT_1052061 [Pholiota molesta]